MDIYWTNLLSMNN